MSDTDTASTTSSDTEQLDMDDLSNPDIINKYRMSGDFVKHALECVIAAAVPGAKVLDLCLLGDASILEKTKTVFSKPVVVKGKKVTIDKGISFPTCVSVNNILGNFCPRVNDGEVVLREGDVAKIELGAHVDGYVAVATHTMVVGGGALKGRKADVVAASQTALEACLRLLRPGVKSTEIPKFVAKVAETYGVSAVEDVRCNNVKRFVLEASNQISIRPRPEEKVDNFEFQEGEAYSIEVAFSTSDEGKCGNKDGEAMVFQRAVDVTYMLKLKASRQLLAEVNTSSPTFAFSARKMEEKLGSTARLGTRELVEHGLLTPYSVLRDHPKETVATCKVTALLLPSGVVKLVDMEYPEVESDKKVEDKELADLLARSLKKTNKKKKKSKK